MSDQPSDDTEDTQPSTPPPGWYDDPWRQAPQRWWDGAGWSDQTREKDDPQGGSPEPANRYLVLGSAAALVVGAFLPWVSMSAPFVGTVSRLGIEGDGMFTAGLGVVALIVAGPLMGNRLLNEKRTGALIIMGVVAALVSGYAAVEVSRTARDLEAAIGQVGVGLWLTVAAAVVLVVGAVRVSRDGP